MPAPRIKEIVIQILYLKIFPAAEMHGMGIPDTRIPAQEKTFRSMFHSFIP